MNLATLRTMLLYCTLINFAMLALWSVLMLLPHAWLHRLWGRWFGVPAEQFDAVCFGGIVLYKILILIFNAVPYIALLLVGGY